MRLAIIKSAGEPDSPIGIRRCVHQGGGAEHDDPDRDEGDVHDHKDNQTVVTIKVYQGEHPLAADNHLLGEFNVEDIPSARAGVPKIEVAFSLDANGILNVIVRDEGDGQ